MRPTHPTPGCRRSRCTGRRPAGRGSRPRRRPCPEALLVELALAGDHRPRGAHPGVEADRVEDERRARDQPAPNAAHRPPEAARRPGHRDTPRVAWQPPGLAGEPRGELSHLLGVGALLGREARAARNGVRTSRGTTSRAPCRPPPRSIARIAPAPPSVVALPPTPSRIVRRPRSGGPISSPVPRVSPRSRCARPPSPDRVRSLPRSRRSPSTAHRELRPDPPSQRIAGVTRHPGSTPPPARRASPPPSAPGTVGGRPSSRSPCRSPRRPRRRVNVPLNESGATSTGSDSGDRPFREYRVILCRWRKPSTS